LQLGNGYDRDDNQGKGHHSPQHGQHRDEKDRDHSRDREQYQDDRRPHHTKGDHKPAHHDQDEEDYYRCASGYVRDHITGSCEKAYGHPGRRVHHSVQPNHEGHCPTDYKKHPFLPLCFSAEIDMASELSISGPHRHLSSSSCQGGWKQHPYLASICIDSRIQFKLNLGTRGISRPDMYGNCKKNWRHHGSIPNLCLDTALDIDLGSDRRGRQIEYGRECPSGWRSTRIPGLCVDSDLEPSRFAKDCRTLASGSCPTGYSRHPVISDLCITVQVAATIKVRFAVCLPWFSAD
jgi:hypothetical protein